eukprot:TRINITY_DN12681_c0_g1_i1.p2 TRINITY_DN12681_c0_g1~~TRINITY_DN12681_c0_g1_i1.p2  ORF type:complete len:104 (+),score=16.30 TRINITY_DN12681_c0_g1_i1:44-313(+)
MKETKLKSVAGEVIALMRTRLDQGVFLQIYSSIRERVQSVRKRRREERVLEAIINPERHAQRKLHQNEKKRERRKAKIEVFRQRRQGFK